MVEPRYAFNFNGERLYLRFTKYYEGDRLAIQVVDAEEQPYAVLTVNIPEIPLQEGEFIVKTWSENAEISDCIRNLGIFEETAKRVKTGHVVAEIWRLKKDPDASVIH